MLNFQIGFQGALTKRTGYEKLFPTSLGAGKINGMFQYRQEDGTIIFLIAHGKTLYKQSGSGQPESVYYMGLSGNPVNFFTVGHRCYIQDGTNLLFYTGLIVGEADANAYVPTVTISRLPAGGGTPYEDFNLIGTGFSDSFSADGTSKEYQLSLTGLDTNSLVSAMVNNVPKLEGEDFTVNKTTGKVTFPTAPTTGTNNVIITAYKTIPKFKERIFKCTMNVLYGGANDTRVFLSGNPDYPNHVWRSGLYEPTYFPENGFYKVGNDSEKVKGFSKQYDYLVIEKESSKWNMQFELNNGVPSFPIKPLNDQIGTVAKDSIQVIDNSPVSLSKNGVYILSSSNVRDERNVQHISGNVDQKLLSEPNLDKAISVDYDKKYWLAVNGNVYVFDYSLNEWYIFDNINASCFFEKDGSLYFGSNTEGIVYRFKKESEPHPYSDDGVAINAYWHSKLLNFGAPEYRKLVKRIFYSLKPESHTSCNLYIRTDAKDEKFIDTTRMDQMDFHSLDFNTFTFITSEVPQEVSRKVKEKKITHVQLKLENKNLDESLVINSLAIKYTIQNEVK